MAAWDDLRQRTRTEGDAVALSPAFRDTLDRHGALMRQAASFRARPQVFERLLSERAGIGANDLDDFERLHERASRHRRAAAMRQVHRDRREQERQDIAPEPRQGELRLEGGRGEASPAPVPEARKPDWRTLHDQLARDWNNLAARAGERNLPMTLMRGYDGLIGRVNALSEHPGLSKHARGMLDELLDYHHRETAACETARTLAGTGETVLGNEERYGAYLDALAAGKPRARLVVDQLRRRMKQPRNSVGEWLFAAGRHMEARGALEDAARHRRIYLTATMGYADWRAEAERLMEEGGGILSGREAGRSRHDEVTPGERRMAAARSALRGVLGADDEEIAARKARARRERATERSRLRFADDLGGTPSEARTRAATTDEVPEWTQPSRPRGAFGRDGQATFERSGLASLERWQKLKLQWNWKLERAGRLGVHVIYTKGFELYRQRLGSMAGDAYLETRIREKIGDVLRVLEEAQARRGHVEGTRERQLALLERRRGEPDLDGSRDGRAAPDRPDYEAWRSGANAAVSAAEDILADPGAYTTHLDAMKRSGGAGLDSALSRVREVLREDDRHVAEALAAREEGIAHILDDPEKLREVRRQYEERMREERRKGRYPARDRRPGREAQRVGGDGDAVVVVVSERTVDRIGEQQRVGAAAVVVRRRAGGAADVHGDLRLPGDLHGGVEGHRDLDPVADGVDVVVAGIRGDRHGGDHRRAGGGGDRLRPGAVAVRRPHLHLVRGAGAQAAQVALVAAASTSCEPSLHAPLPGGVR